MSSKKNQRTSGPNDHDRAHQWYLDNYGPAPAAAKKPAKKQPKGVKAAREAEALARAKQYGRDLEAAKRTAKTSPVARKKSSPSKTSSANKRSSSKILDSNKRSTEGLQEARAYFDTLEDVGKKQKAQSSKRSNRPPSVVMYETTWESDDTSDDVGMKGVESSINRRPEPPATLERALEVYERKPAAVGGPRTKKRSPEASNELVYFEAMRGEGTTPRGSAALARASMAQMDLVPTRVCVEYERSKRSKVAGSKDENAGFVSSFFRYLSLED